MVDTEATPTGAGRRATIVDVAKHAGVSTASASKVLRKSAGVSSEMRERVHASMAALSYRPHRLARGMRGRTFTIGVMLSDIENPFFSLLVQGIGDVLADEDYDMLIAPGSFGAASQGSVIDSLIDQQMDGLILVGPRSPRAHLEEVGAQIPTVAIGSHGPSERYDTVSGDDERGASLVVEHLVALGHERIGFFANERPSGLDDIPEAVREVGFRTAMDRRGLSTAGLVFPGHWTVAGGRSVVPTLLSSTASPTAVFAGADVAAIGMLSELWDRGVEVPGRLSVVGYDNSPSGALAPIGLTSVDQDGQAMGARAARLLLERMDGRTAPRNEMRDPALLPRRTSAAPGS